MKDEGEDQVKKKNACFWCGQEGHKAMNCKAMYGRARELKAAVPTEGTGNTIFCEACFFYYTYL